MQDSKFYNKYFKEEKKSNKLWLTKLLLSIIFLLSSLIYININSKNKDIYLNNILEDNIKFSKLNKLYDKYISNIFTKETTKQEEQLVFNDNLVQESITKYNNSNLLKVEPNSEVNTLKPGIIVYIGPKDDLGNTIIIQGNDGVDIWYSNIYNTEYSLYDYVKENSTIGITNDENLYITIHDNGKYLTYEEYLK